MLRVSPHALSTRDVRAYTDRLFHRLFGRMQKKLRWLPLQREVLETEVWDGRDSLFLSHTVLYV